MSYENAFPKSYQLNNKARASWLDSKRLPDLLTLLLLGTLAGLVILSCCWYPFICFLSS